MSPDCCGFSKNCDRNLVMVAVYVPDLIVAADQGADADSLQEDLSASFRMSSEANLQFMLALQI
jgi:hypothetical protein